MLSESATRRCGPSGRCGSWPVGIVGLVASKLAEERQRPAVVGADLGGMVRASCRSAGGLHLAEIGVGASADGTLLSDHTLPDGTMAVAHIRDERMRLVRSDTELRAGDVVLALAESEKAARSAHSSLQ